MSNNTIDIRRVGKLIPIAGAEGAEGIVYRAPSLDLGTVTGPLVVKRFIGGERSIPQLVDLIEWRTKLPPEDGEIIDTSTCWPLQVVVKGGSAWGIVMREVPEGFSQEVLAPGGKTIKLREAQWLFLPDHRLARRGVDLMLTNDRRRLCLSLATVLAVLHRHGAAYGDLSPRNVIYAVRPRPLVCLLDCDTVRIGDVEGSRPALESPDWDDPASTGVPDVSSDRYKLALFVVRAIGQTLRDRAPDAAAPFLGTDGLALAECGLSIAQPTGRTSAAEWQGWLAEHLGPLELPASR